GRLGGRCVYDWAELAVGEYRLAISPVQMYRPARHLDVCFAGEPPAAAQAVVACGPPQPGAPHATTWRSGDVVHGIGNLDLVAGVAAEQVAVLVAEVGDDLVALAGDVLAGTGLVFD